MADNVLKIKVKERCDTEANWIKNNPVLLKGEVSIVSDKGNIRKTGNGTTTWKDLPYDKTQWADINDKPSTFPPSSHNHDAAYVNVTGDTMTGALNITNGTASTSVTTGALKVAGGIATQGRASTKEVAISDKVVLSYSDEALNFIFK